MGIVGAPDSETGLDQAGYAASMVGGRVVKVLSNNDDIDIATDIA